MSSPPAYPICIVVCFRNPGDLVDHTLSQLERFAEAEQLILVDDASTDGTADRLRSWSARNPRSTVIALAENHGPARARNIAVGHVRSEYVWFVDDDDEPAPDALAVFARAIRHGEPHLVLARARFRSADGAERWADGVDETRVLGRQEALASVLRGDVQGFLWSKLFHRSVLGGEPFGHDYPQEDFVGVVGAIERSARIALSPASVYTYLERPDSVSRGRRPDFHRYAAARDAAVEAAGRAGLDGDLIAYFRLWFYALAVAFVPVRRRATAADVAEGVRLASAELRGLDLSACAAFNAQAAVHGRIILLTGRLYPVALKPALWLHDLLRRLRR
ncbi:glycosyltransferase family 2 protein [Leifsonia shinshuensis]|uniref:Glycosyltransferase family 2 protein n=1 Tax=Leifsonia shinshuensis TaxID=150026 RepID=A0A7G6YF09_9MICO|nr:glycosyltransferase family 2 protein [Leifsonia shinshuensis]QNE37074.1 glycosyltransferase family 2 protein [Leifsonia shinshuensis]